MNNVVDLSDYRDSMRDLRGKLLNVLEASRDWMTARELRAMVNPLGALSDVRNALDTLYTRGAIETQRATHSNIMLYRYAETDQ